MAANGMRRALQVSSSSAKILFGRSSAASSSSKIGKSAGIAFGNGSSSSSSSSSRPSLRRLTFSSRVPVELSAGVSLVPLHSVTASALLTSLLSLSNQNWSCLSEGFASTL
ncbi:PREDICTED: protein NUCLEAR FUSION DEFECTIVE 6, chloroplastic/mitochondrial isoform X1 [Camelina sativa]|uniref:Protein NUCLEAR FUSION DEFECTIVE 6, chloroplastic/mitochondrial isoform X1 n=1 Tax=Camelina sativa TaxID=90675 RepID=A0ABM0TKN7_CAMSA|nr:PREDICTED: protein NUCLEAR FUSION DEFECTIVE 6, chloroplastic/mitochondrial isoform X1 [Camelina sativa]